MSLSKISQRTPPSRAFLANANPGAVALDEGVVVDLRTVPDLDRRAWPRRFDVAVAGVIADGSGKPNRTSRPRMISPSPMKSTGWKTIGSPVTSSHVESARYVQTLAD